MKRVLLAAFLACLAAPVLAQELDVFELTDFVDPRLRGAETRELKVVERPANYQFIRAMIGGVSNYTTRTDVTRQDIGFVHIASSFYSGLNQLNLRLTTMRPSGGDSRRPPLRVTAQYARYTFDWLEDKEKGTKDEIAERGLFTLAVEERDLCRLEQVPGSGQTPVRRAKTHAVFGAGLVCSRHTDSEIGAQYDGSLVPQADSDFVRMSFGVRHTVEDGMIYRGTVGVRYRFTNAQRSRFSLGFDHSIERAAGSFHLGATRFHAAYALSLAKRAWLNAVWQPSYTPREPGRKVNNEFGLFVDATLLARLSPPSH